MNVHTIKLFTIFMVYEVGIYIITIYILKHKKYVINLKKINIYSRFTCFIYLLHKINVI